MSLGSMGRMNSTLEITNSKIYVNVLLGFLLICTVGFSSGDTNPVDGWNHLRPSGLVTYKKGEDATFCGPVFRSRIRTAAINSLYAALGYPVLPGWSIGGDPCGQAWQGVVCNGSDIVRIVLNAANLEGQLGDGLGSFSSIRAIDLSNNHIGGSIPSNLPVTMQNFFLSDNQFSGSIPTSLSTLTQLAAMSLNDNLLTGELPDAFQSLTGLINLDLSSNNLSGELPPSLENLSSLTTLRLQNNQLSGTLDVLQDLPLRDLNVENNQFSGPIPQKLLSIPNFKKEGNPFNVTSTKAPVPPPRSAVTPPPGQLISGDPQSSGQTPTPTKQAAGPSAPKGSSSGKQKKSVTKKRVIWISISGALLFIILVLALVLFMPRCSRRREEVDRISKRHQIGAYEGDRQNARDNEALTQPTNQTEKGTVVRPKEDHQGEIRRVGAIPKPRNEQETNVQRMGTIPKQEDHEINMSALDVYLMTPPPPPPPPPPSTPPPPPPPPVERVIVEPIVTSEATTMKPSRTTAVPHTSAKSFTIASLQQYTNSFSQENLIGGGMLGNVYKAKLPDGKLLAVKKLDKRVSDQQRDDEFLDLVNNVDRIRHANVVELIGYCAEHGQRLLIYEYCSNGTLQDALHSDDEFKKKFSWNARIRMALGAARALEYLHEVCEPPVVHRNFKSANILLDDDISARVSDCGLAPLIASGSVSQLSGQLLSTYGYGAPEFETGTYTSRSDVYSFGVVMLELLTGRESYDRTRNRGEQFLVRWAIPQLHDIDALSRMVDPSLKDYPAKSLSNFADIISRCVQSEPEFRPQMSEVVQDLLDMIRRERYGSGSNED